MQSLREKLFGPIKPLREKLEKAKELAVATAKEIPGEMAKQVGQPMLRGFGAVGAKIAAGDINAQFTPQGQFQKDLYGTDKPIGFTSVAEETLGGFKPESDAGKAGMAVLGAGLSVADAIPGGGQAKKGVSGAAKAFDGFTDLTTKTLDKLVGRGKVSKQFISDLLNAPDVRQAEKDVMRAALDEADDVVDVASYADKVKTNLLPLTTKRADNLASKGAYDTPRYENITLPPNLRGPIANYSERIYESPIAVSAGRVHMGDDAPNYFAHTRVEDIPDISPRKNPDKNAIYNPDTDYVTAGGAVFDKKPGTTRRVIEVQSDLMQKGRLERESAHTYVPLANDTSELGKKYNALNKEFDRIQRGEEYTWGTQEKLKKLSEIKRQMMDVAEEWSKPRKQAREAELSKLAPYRNTWHERIIREEVKQAAVDGKTKLQFPVGKTAMQIEGLGSRNTWVDDSIARNGADVLRPEQLRVGQTVRQGNQQYEWVVTNVLGDGKFEAMPKAEYLRKKSYFDAADPSSKGKQTLEEFMARSNLAEQFDISGKVDEANPIYKFYEKEVGKFLQKNYSAKRITDPQGVEWWEMDVKPDWKDKAVFAHGMSKLGATLGVAGAGAAAVAGKVAYDNKERLAMVPDAVKEVYGYEGEEPVAEPAKEPERIQIATTTSEMKEPEKKGNFDRETFRKGIAHNESRGASDPYKAVGPTKDLGKYQASPATLKGWSKAWLGREYTPEEFLNDPDAQERFFAEYTKVAERLGLTHEQAAVAWHRGWGELGTGSKDTRDARFLKRLNEMMDDEISQAYLNSFRRGTGD